MAELRPRGMSQGELAELLRENGFTACSKAAVSLAERSKISGVQFTPEARNVVRGVLKSTSRPENRKNGRKTTIWFDEETRAWLETQAYLTDTNVGEIVRRIVAEAKTAYNEKKWYDGMKMSPIAQEAYDRLQDEYRRLEEKLAELKKKAAADLVHPQRQE